mmetsp:Transcript_17595/g.31782  ORF Transcript_17595/g.31782 Transcript_17595/m.31782 type:complete len:353 (-) Transcript_17595:9-1067(-)
MMQHTLLELVLLSSSFSAVVGLSLRAADTREVFDSELESTTVWSGLEPSEDEPPSVGLIDISSGTTQNLTVELDSESRLRGRLPYILLGPEDSGTNLLEHIIESNWPGKFVSTNKANMLWKHSLWRKEIYSLLKKEFKDLKRFPAIAALRSPISQVASWRKAPYDMKLCVARDLDKLNTPCSADLSARPIGYRGWLKSVGFRRTNFKSFNTTMDVYNEYVRQYKSMARERLFKSFSLVLYEDMVFSPDRVVQELAMALGVPEPPHIQLVDAPAKKAGKPVGREVALDKLLSRKYMEDMGLVGLKTLCPSLDLSLVEGMVEGSYLPLDEQTPYSSDCDSLNPPANADASSKYT